MSLRRFLGRLARRTVPPLISHALISRAARHPRLHRSVRCLRATYSGVYGSFKEMAEAFPPSDYYPDDSLSELVEERRRHVAAGPGDLEVNDRYSFLSTLVALQPEPTISVLDVGAGLGEALDYLKLGCPGKRVEYRVLELPQVVELAGHTATNTDIEFHTDLRDVRHVDVVFFGSSFQYFESRFEMLQSILELNPIIVAISDSRMGDMPAFVTAQVNMPRRIIPSWVNNKGELVEFFLSQGYSLVNQFTNQCVDNFDNFPPRIRDTARSWSLVFKRVTSDETANR